MSFVLVLATSKGGAGKSTLVRNLAAHWFNIGKNIAVIDADPQASIYSRHDFNGPLAKMKVISEPEENVQYVIDEIKSQYDIVVVDTGGFRNRTTIRALIKSNLAIIPLKPSADDVSGAVETYNLIKELNETSDLINNPIKYRMVLTMTQQGTVIARHIRQELEGAGYFLLKGEMFHRVSYPEAALNGLSPCITDPEGAAARDISTIVNEINEVLKL
jgi:chromosome partitioning protein